MKRCGIFIFIWFCLFASKSFASEYTITCVENDDRRFTVNYIVNETNKTIFMKNSFNPQSGQKWETNEYLDIIEWRKNRIILAKHNFALDGIPTAILFNLNLKKSFNVGFYADQVPFVTSRTCF